MRRGRHAVCPPTHSMWCCCCTGIWCSVCGQYVKRCGGDLTAGVGEWWGSHLCIRCPDDPTPFACGCLTACGLGSGPQFLSCWALWCLAYPWKACLLQHYACPFCGQATSVSVMLPHWRQAAPCVWHPQPCQHSWQPPQPCQPQWGQWHWRWECGGQPAGVCVAAWGQHPPGTAGWPPRSARTAPGTAAGHGTAAPTAHTGSHYDSTVWWYSCTHKTHSPKDSSTHLQRQQYTHRGYTNLINNECLTDLPPTIW